jgi:hypothetical protein
MKQFSQWLFNGFALRSSSAAAMLAWLVAFAAALLSAVWLRRSLMRGRIETRLSKSPCVKCGYDLRATPGRCPECGSVPEKVNG